VQRGEAASRAEGRGGGHPFDGLRASLGVKLRYLDGWNDGRRRVAQCYNELLAGLPMTRPYESPHVYHVYHQYTIRAPQRDALAAYLKDRGIGTMIYYPVPLHLQRLYASLGCGEGSLPCVIDITQGLPTSEAASREVLALPMYPELT